MGVEVMPGTLPAGAGRVCRCRAPLGRFVPGVSGVNVRLVGLTTATGVSCPFVTPEARVNGARNRLPLTANPLISAIRASNRKRPPALERREKRMHLPHFHKISYVVSGMHFQETDSRQRKP